MGSLLLHGETKKERNFPERSVVRILSSRGSLFCRPQTPWRMIHKSAIREERGDFLPSSEGFLPRPEQIDPVDREFQDARKQWQDDKSRGSRRRKEVAGR